MKATLVIGVAQKYPKELSSLHANLPFAPSRHVLTGDALSEYQQLYSDIYDRSPTDINLSRLVLSLEDKKTTKYTIII